MRRPSPLASFGVLIALWCAASSARAGDTRSQKAIANPPVVASLPIECSVKLRGCGWGACGYDVIATNTSGSDLPSGYTVRATITYKVVNVNNLMNPAEVKTDTREKAVPHSGLPKGRSIGLGDLTLGSQGQNLGCQATAGP